VNSLDCLLVEGRSYDIAEGSNESILNYCRGSLDKQLIVKAIESMSKSIGEYSDTFLRISKKIFGFPLKLDTPPPVIKGNRIKAGYWVGVYEYVEKESKSVVRLIIAPQLREYRRMLHTVDEVLGKLSEDFKLLTRMLPASATSFALLSLIKLVLLELNRLVEHEPKRFSSLVESPVGEVMEVILAPTPAYKVFKQVFTPNLKLYLTVVLTLENLGSAVKELSKLLREAEDMEKVIQLSGTDRSYYEGLIELVKQYVDEVKSFIKVLVNSAYVQHMLTYYTRHMYEITKLDVYDYLVRTSRKLRQGLFSSPEGAGAYSRQILFPSTKLYELYVYANTVRLYSQKKRVKPEYKPKLTIAVGNAKFYYNHYPRKLSRVIAAITTKHRTPRPDILFYRNSKTVVIDAKYRKLDSNKPRLLGLPDAERIAAYLLDAVYNDVLQAIVVSLSKPPQELVEKARKRIKSLDGKRLNIEFVEMNPDTTVEDITGHLP